MAFPVVCSTVRAHVLWLGFCFHLSSLCLSTLMGRRWREWPGELPAPSFQPLLCKCLLWLWQRCWTLIGQMVWIVRCIGYETSRLWTQTQHMGGYTERPVETVEGVRDEMCVTGKYALCFHVGEQTELLFPHCIKF